MTASPPVPAGPRPADRFFLAILVGMGLLLGAAVVSVITLRQSAIVPSADTPAGVVQRFYLALEARDYYRAYDLLGEQAAAQSSRDDFVRQIADRQNAERPQRVRIDDERISGDSATVSVTITYFSANAQPFGGGEYSIPETFSLQRTAAGWRISDLPYRYRPYPHP